VANGVNTINEIDINLIEANPNQPRREFDEEALQELSDSIREIGIIQPITLREMGNGKYQIIAGERRWRASMRAQMKTIPAYIRSVNDESLMEMALIENIQRQDLNPVEIALAYQQLIEQYGLTQEKLAEKVGKKRTTVANFLRLLKLPAPIQVGLRNKTIDTGHARALLAIDDPKTQVKAYKEILDKGLSVRKVEEFVKKLKDGDEKEPVKAKSQQTNMSDEIKALEQKLAGKCGLGVSVKVNDKGAGKVVFKVKNMNELHALVEKMQ
jgi:ParB family chromosome partitioning protein